MTREEAIKRLQKQKEEYLDEWVDFSGVAEAYDMAIEALSAPSGDLISRADAIEAVLTYFIPRSHTGERGEHEEDFVRTIFKSLPSAEAEQGDYAKWLENIIVKAETIEWLCEDTPCKEWCDENCHYSSIQAECLRHLYEVSKGGGDE